MADQADVHPSVPPLPIAGDKFAADLSNGNDRGSARKSARKNSTSIKVSDGQKKSHKKERKTKKNKKTKKRKPKEGGDSEESDTFTGTDAGSDNSDGSAIFTEPDDMTSESEDEPANGEAVDGDGWRVLRQSEGKNEKKKKKAKKDTGEKEGGSLKGSKRKKREEEARNSNPLSKSADKMAPTGETTGQPVNVEAPVKRKGTAAIFKRKGSRPTEPAPGIIADAAAKKAPPRPPSNQNSVVQVNEEPLPHPPDASAPTKKGSGKKSSKRTKKPARYGEALLAGGSDEVFAPPKKEPPKRPSRPPPSDAVKRVQEERQKQKQAILKETETAADAEDDANKDSELSPQLLSVMITTFHDYLVMILYTSGGLMAEQSLSRLAEVDLLFKWPIGRRIFASSVHKLLQQLPSPCLTEEGFEVMLLLMHKLLAQIETDKDVENDWIVASVVMNAASTLYRIEGDSTQYLQEFVKPYKIWKDMIFWSNCFWDAIAELQEQHREKEMRRKVADLNSRRGRTSGESLPLSQYEAKRSPRDRTSSPRLEKILSSRLRRIYAPNQAMVASQLCSFAYNMLSWSVRASLIRDLIDLVCELTTLPEDRKKSLIEIVESFQANVIEPEPEQEATPTISTGAKKQKRRQVQSECYERLVFPDNVNEANAELREVRAGGLKKSSPANSPPGPQRGPGPIPTELSDQDMERIRKGSYIKKLLVRKVGDDQIPGSPPLSTKTEQDAQPSQSEKESQVKALVEGMTREVQRATGNVQELAMNLNKEIYQEVQLTRRDKVVEELLATEKTYVDHLSTLLQAFIEPVEKSGILSERECKTIFSNIRDILELNKMFYTRLDDRMRSWPSMSPAQQLLSDIFMQVFPFMKIYASYCGNYLEAAALVTKLETMAKFREFGRQLVAIKGLDLFSYLIMPVQRIPRYQLLLQEILKETSNYHPDYKKLSASLDIIKGVAGFINKSHSSDFSKVIQIQTQFGKAVSLIAPWRKWLKDDRMGVLLAIPNLTSGYSYQAHPIHGYLFNDLFVYSRGDDRYLGQFSLATTWIRDLHDSEVHETLFQLYSPPNTVITLVAPDLKTKYLWLKDIVSAITKWIECLPVQKERREAGLRARAESEIMDPFLPEHIKTSVDDAPPFSLAEFSTSGYIAQTITTWFTLPAQPQQAKKTTSTPSLQLSIPSTEPFPEASPAAFPTSASGSHVARNAPQAQLLHQTPRGTQQRGENTASMQSTMTQNPRAKGSQIGAAVPSMRGSQVGGAAIRGPGSQVGASVASPNAQPIVKRTSAYKPAATPTATPAPPSTPPATSSTQVSTPAKQGWLNRTLSTIAPAPDAKASGAKKSNPKRASRSFW